MKLYVFIYLTYFDPLITEYPDYLSTLLRALLSLFPIYFSKQLYALSVNKRLFAILLQDSYMGYMEKFVR